MKDITSLNYQYLLIARELGKSSAGRLLTGLPKNILERLAEMSLEEIEDLAATSGVCLVSIRFSEAQMLKLLNMPNSYRTTYAMSISSEQR